MIFTTKIIFGGTDLFAAFGICCETRRDVLHPPEVDTKIHIPGRDGSYDPGAQWYGDREIELSCFSTAELTRQQLRELAYVLSGKKKLILDDEPDKYYMARLWDPSVITHIGRKGTKHTLKFVCEPFAYGETVTLPLESGENPAAYQGTARAPALLVIRNVDEAEASNIHIAATFKRN